MNMRWVLLFFAVFFSLAIQPAEAARPFVTDDARLTTAGSCQLESWTRFYRNSTEAWATPACNPTGNLEFTLGGGLVRYPDVSLAPSEDYIIQLKTLMRQLHTNDWGWGLAVGTIHHPKVNPGPNLLGNTYLYLPVSKSFADDLVVVHVNTGWLHDKVSDRDRMTWGLGSEINTSERLMLVSETFGDNQSSAYWQAGLRYAIVPRLLQVDATLGRQFGGSRETKWLSFGLRITPDKMVWPF